MKNNLSSQINTLFVVFSKLEFYYVSIAIPTKYSYTYFCTQDENQ